MSDKINYDDFDAILAEQLLNQLGGEEMRRAIINLLGQGATKRDIVGRLLEILPTWKATAVQLGVVVDYLMAGREGV